MNCRGLVKRPIESCYSERFALFYAQYHKATGGWRALVQRYGADVKHKKVLDIYPTLMQARNRVREFVRNENAVLRLL